MADNLQLTFRKYVLPEVCQCVWLGSGGGGGGGGGGGELWRVGGGGAKCVCVRVSV